jgi:large subunit ribosomal protein L3
MVKGILGKKIGMSRIFDSDGNSIPVTVIHTGGCNIIQVKTTKVDGYKAVQLGYGAKRKKLFNKPISGHFAKAEIEPRHFLTEIGVESDEGLTAGQEVKLDIFKVGEKVKVSGISKGLGFQGGVRRHHFRGGPKTHGQSDRLRAPGSVGASSFPSRTFKGQKMAGRMGAEKVTVKNLRVVEMDQEKKLLILEGAVPGKKDTLLKIIKK